MKFKALVIIALCLIEYSAISQDIQVYNGDYTLNSMGAVGTAKYSYYEDENYQRIYNGDFTLSVSKSYLKSCVITGKFKNDIRDGEWTVKATLGDPYNTDYVLNANYIDGQPNGIWTTVAKKGNNIIMSDKRSLVNGLLIDTWEFFDADQDSKLKMELDKDGFIIESDLSQGGIQRISKFKGGYEILSVKRNIQTGESDVNRVEDEDILETLSKIEQYSKNYPDSLQELPYRLEKKQADNEMLEYLDVPYLFLFPQDVRGAEVYSGHQFYGLYENRLVKQIPTTVLYNERINYADQAFNSQNFAKAIDYYNEALKIKKTEYANNKILECNKKIEEIEEQKIKQIEQYVSEGDDYFIKYNFRESKNSYDNAINIGSNNYASNRLRLIRDYEKDPNKYYEKAIDFSTNNQLDSAIHYYRIVYYFYPEDPSVCNGLGWHLILSKKFDDALNIFKVIVPQTSKSDESYPYLLGNLAHCYLLTNNFEMATNIYYNNLDLTLNGKSWAEAVVTDFNEFIDLGIKNEQYIEIAKKLKMKKLLNTDE